ncbi:hypothetical protein QZN06_02240 [Burkholderia multivorans]|uniref:hypothetical protein n=1 Tax=Burkholderia multivorans TaxID=87883 RepID=UPI0012FE26E1|nr:hypothetical protein [Burkholderia multivorans]MBJ9658889.1 hypothetical protein [Burkholderia multivorans]MBU9472690.1 hypothetical protein [Burkholderia multivorans]MDN8007381.1 hypothetical protein [Burkholderia multivorans]
MSEPKEDSTATEILVELIRGGSVKLPYVDSPASTQVATKRGEEAAAYLVALHKGLKAID